MERYYTFGEIANIVGVDITTCRYHRNKGLIPEPTIPIGNRCVYTPEDMATVVEFYKNWEPWITGRKKKATKEEN